MCGCVGCGRGGNYLAVCVCVSLCMEEIAWRWVLVCMGMNVCVGVGRCACG